MILPERVFGRSSVNRTVFGLAIGPIAFGDVLAQLGAELVAGLVAGAQDHERADRLARGRVGAADHRGLGDRRDGSTSALSTSAVEMLCPLTSITSSTRPSSQK